MEERLEFPSACSHRPLRSQNTAASDRQPALAATVCAQWRSHPILTLRGIAIGWVVLLAIVSQGDLLVEGAAGWLFDWKRQETGYAQGIWGPFYVCSVALSSLAFLLSGAAVTRSNRGTAFAALAGFAGSVILAVTISVGVVAVSFGPLPVPHFWFYVMWLALPFVARVGLLAIPAIIVLGGWLGMRPAA